MSTQSPLSDLDQMTKRFAEIWGEQWRQMMTKPETAQAMLKLTELMAPSQLAAQQMMARFMSPDFSAEPRHAASPSQTHYSQHTPHTTPQDGTAALAAALGTLARQLDELGTRVDALASRLDTMDKPKPRKPRAKPVAKAAAKPARTAGKRAQPARKPAAKPTRKGR